ALRRGNASRLPKNHQGREVKAMNDEGNGAKKLFEGFSDMTSTLFNPESTRKIAKLWIENSERAADEVLKFQAKATGWAKNTMLAPIFEMKNSLTRSCVEISTKTARRLWQVEYLPDLHASRNSGARGGTSRGARRNGADAS